MVWRAFNKNLDTLPQKIVIIDDDGLITEIDESYRSQGERENWLHFTGIRERNGIEYICYRLGCTTFVPH